MFTSILSSTGTTLTIATALTCMATSLALGVLAAVFYMASGNHSKTFTVTIALLPVLVQNVIMMVNGNLGTGVAVLGAFSLIRFRSVPGSSKEISAIFFSMAIGLATGMGQIQFAVVMTLCVGAVFLILSKSAFGNPPAGQKTLRILIPENLDYTSVFDDIFHKYTNETILNSVKTTNLGSMFELEYHIRLIHPLEEKEMIDELRCRNGNLTILCSKVKTTISEL